MTDELKPCPFCGCECELKEIQFAFDLKQYANHPYNDCILGSLRIVPVSIWNARPLEDTLQTEIDKLCAELKLNSIQISIGNDSIMSLQKRIDELESQLAQVAKENDWMKYPEPPESGAK